jgi:PAS domain S-box-containing protein
MAEPIVPDGESLKQILDKARTGICVIQDGAIKYINATLTDLLGYSWEDLIGKSPAIFIYPDDRASAVEKMTRFFDERRKEYVYEVRAICKDGQVIVTQVLGKTLPYEGRQAIVAYVLDITDQTLEKSQLTQFADIITHMLSGLLVFHLDEYTDDGSLRLVNINPALAETFGMSRRDLVGHLVDEIFPNLKNNGIREKLANVVRTGQPTSVDSFTSPHPNLAGKILSVIAFAIPDSCVCAIVEDVTPRKAAEEGLITNEKRFKDIAETSQEFIWEVDANGLYTYASPFIAKLLGYTPEELVGKLHFYDLAPQDSREQLKAGALEAFERRETIVGLPNYARHKDGRVILLETNGLPVVDAAGKLLGYRGSDKDITERKAAEEELRVKSALMTGVVESAMAHIFSVDPQYRYTSFNTSHAALMKRIYGADIEIGKSILDYMTVPEDREKAKANLDEALAGRHIIKSSYTGEEKRSRIYVEVAHHPVLGADGRVIGAAVFANDITEKKRSEEALAESEKKYKSIFENVLVGISQSTPEGRFTSVNPALVKMLGYSSPEEIIASVTDIGKQLYADPKQREAIIDILNRDGYVENFEAEMIRKDKMHIWISLNLRGVRGDNGELESLESTAVDITDRKRIEEEIKRLRE